MTRPTDADLAVVRSCPLLAAIWGDLRAAEPRARDARLALELLRAGVDENRATRLLRALPISPAARVTGRDDAYLSAVLAEARLSLGEEAEALPRARALAEGLGARARADAGAPYEPESIEALALLREHDPPTWARTRAELRTAGVFLRDLERRVREIAEARAAARSTGDEDHETLGIPADPEPWPDPVDGAQLLHELTQQLQRYLVVGKDSLVALALWIVHTYALDEAEHSPRLAITSFRKRCGKTRVLAFLAAAVCRPLRSASVTTATLFRVVEAQRPTLLIDEADTFLGADRDDALRGVLNAGFQPDERVLRAEGKKIRGYRLYGAVALAAIGDLPDTIADRSIAIRMRRRLPGERVERLRQSAAVAALEPCRRQAVRWVQDHAEDLLAADPDVPEALHDRAQDCWRPLLALADAAGGEWPARARQAAIAVSQPPRGSRHPDPRGPRPHLPRARRESPPDEGDPGRVQRAPGTALV